MKLGWCEYQEENRGLELVIKISTSHLKIILPIGWNLVKNIYWKSKIILIVEKFRYCIEARL